MSSLTNQQQKIAEKVLKMYLPIHSRMVSEIGWNKPRKNKAIANFMEWVGKYARTARNPTNQNINKAYNSKFR